MFEAAAIMGKINVYDKIMIENQKYKRKYGNRRNYT